MQDILHPRMSWTLMNHIPKLLKRRKDAHTKPGVEDFTWQETRFQDTNILAQTCNLQSKIPYRVSMIAKGLMSVMNRNFKQPKGLTFFLTMPTSIFQPVSNRIFRQPKCYKVFLKKPFTMTPMVFQAGRNLIFRLS